MLALVAERKKIAQQFPNLVDYEAKRAFTHFYEPAPHARRRLADQGHRGQEGLLRHQRRVEITRPFKRSLDGVAGEAPHARASASRACSTSTRRRRSSGRTSRRSASRSRTSSSATRPPRRCGSRAASTARSTRAYPSKVAQAHIHNLLFHQHTGRRSRSSTSSSRSSRTCRTSSTDTMDNASLPDRRRRARRDEGRLHEGGRLLRHARHRVPRSGALVRRAEPDGEAHVRDLGPAPRHHRGRERPRAAARAGRRSTHLRARPPGEGPRHPRDRRGRGPRRDPPARRARTTPIRA